MKRETQASRLSHLVQAHTEYRSYELILPMVKVSKKRLQKIAVGDIVLVGLKTLVLSLMHDEIAYGHVALRQGEDGYSLEIVDTHQQMWLDEEQKKLTPITFVCASVKLKTLQIGQRLEDVQCDMNHISLVLDHKNIARCSLVSVDDEIAVKIDKVLV